MGPCCVEGCQVTAEETFYFEFPTSRILRRKWLELIPIRGKLPLGTVVCSRHFHEHDYESVRGKVRLKSKVVPSLLLDQKPTSPIAPRPKSPSPSKDAEPSSSKSPKSPTSPKSPKSPLSPPSPAQPADACDSTTVSAPSPVDAEKMIDELQRRIVKKLVKIQNGVSKRFVKCPPLAPIIVPPLDHKEDIEDMITNYHIKNKVPNPALLADLVPAPAPLEGLVGQCGHTVPVEFEYPQNNEVIEIDDAKEAQPVFIEVSVDKEGRAASAGSEDCLMLLESVQVDVDPSTLLLAHDDDYYQQECAALHKKEEPISLLTSSDEDDVILQEPKIDTVEVSDETDEDDMPLVKLVKQNLGTSKKKFQKRKLKIKKPEKAVSELVWGMYDFYCVQCHYSTKSISDYDKHVSEHSTVLLVCPICSYTSSSKSMFARHTRIHKVEKKFKCHLCDYKARHKMSLIYHIKHHSSEGGKCDKFKFKRRHFKSGNTAALANLSEKKHVCEKCDYATKKKSDLKRHALAMH